MKESQQLAGVTYRPYELAQRPAPPQPMQSQWKSCLYRRDFLRLLDAYFSALASESTEHVSSIDHISFEQPLTVIAGPTGF